MSESGLCHFPDEIEQQQTHISPTRWGEEAEILLECTNISLQDSKAIEREIMESPFANPIYNLLSELFKECESLPSRLTETTRDSRVVAENMQKLDELLEENFNSTVKESTDFAHLDGIDVSSTTKEAYKNKIYQIKQVYTSQHQKVDSLCTEHEKGILGVFRDQPECIPIAEDKIDSIIQSSRDRSQFIYLELKTNVAEAVCSVKKELLEKCSRRRKRNFSKQATEILNEYFYSHLDSLYPSQEIKTELAVKCNISLGQINNWFGNKRIRYKRNTGKGNYGDTDSKISSQSDSGDIAAGLSGDILSSSEEEIDSMDVYISHVAQLT